MQFARDFLIRQALPARVLPGGTDEAQGEAASAYLGELSSTARRRVAARFGTWDPSLNGLGPVPDDLSFVPGAKPAATPSPAPSSELTSARMPGRLVLLATSPACPERPALGPCLVRPRRRRRRAAR